MSDMFLVCMLLVRGCQTLLMGPNNPTATIIGEYSASLQGAALILSLVRARNSGSDKKSRATSLATTSLMSDMFIVCMLLVRGCQTLVMDPTILLQQSLVSTVPHCKGLHQY